MDNAFVPISNEASRQYVVRKTINDPRLVRVNADGSHTVIDGTGNVHEIDSTFLWAHSTKVDE